MLAFGSNKHSGGGDWTKCLQGSTWVWAEHDIATGPNIWIMLINVNEWNL